MGVVQMTIDQIIDVVAMGHRFVAAARAVDMAAVMSATIVLGGAGARVGGRHADDVLIDMALVRVMEMSVVKIIDMIVVLDGGMTAAGLMLMGVFRMSVAGGHNYLLLMSY